MNKTRESLSDGQDDLSNFMNDVELREKTVVLKVADEEEGKHLLKEEKNEENSERTEEKINLKKVSFVQHKNIRSMEHSSQRTFDKCQMFGK